MAFWNKKSPDDRVAEALERLVKLKELELAAKGLTLWEGTEEGEVFETDDQLIAKREYEDELRAKLGLPRDAPIGVIDPATGKEWAPPAQVEGVTFGFEPGPGYGIGVGPEGAESPESGAQEERHEG